MTEPSARTDEILRATAGVLLIDWPTRDVPESLLRAARSVVVKGGPGPDSYAHWKLRDGAIVTDPPGGAPEHADLVYAYRPLTELPAVFEIARQVGAHTVWLHLDHPSAVDVGGARRLAEAGGVDLVIDPDIVDRVKALSTK